MKYEYKIFGIKGKKIDDLGTVCSEKKMLEGLSKAFYPLYDSIVVLTLFGQEICEF